MAGQSQRRDPNTQSNYDQVRTTQVNISYDINFKEKILAGNVILAMKVVAEEGCRQVILDTR
jgi:hypothetical protein